MIEINDVSKSYNGGEVKAVDRLNIKVLSGEIFGFLGPNGAGKTTTIKMITGLLNPDEGSILIDGCDIQKNPVDAKKKIGYVPDNPDVYERLSGMEYLNFLADVHRVSSIQRKERINEILGIFNMLEARKDLIKSYSHGMKQKIAIAGALIHNPRVWILDEPLVGLDPKAAFLLKELMRKHCEAGNTVFFSTHIMEVAEKLCNRIGIIKKGKLAAVGTLDEIKDGKKNSLESIFLELTEDVT